MRTATLAPISPDTVQCPCGRAMPVIPTAYGYRATCVTEHIRWTWMAGEPPHTWTAEPFQPNTNATKGTS